MKDTSIHPRLIFLYDALMTKKEQELINIYSNLSFVSFGCVKGKIIWYREPTKKKSVLIPSYKPTTKQVYGAIYLLEDYQNNKHRLHSYYGSTEVYNNYLTPTLLPLSITTFEKIIVTPIKFNSLMELKNCEFTQGRNVYCESFIGNLTNETIKHHLKRYKYYKANKMNEEDILNLTKQLNGINKDFCDLCNIY